LNDGIVIEDRLFYYQYFFNFLGGYLRPSVWNILQDEGYGCERGIRGKLLYNIGRLL
jgi:hypothetical protein